MNYFFRKSIVVSSIALATLFGTLGCSGGGTSGNSSTSVTTSGAGYDGILVGSTVCIDTDGDGLCSDELATDKDITDGEGKFTITSTSTGPLLLIGGTDLSTNAPFTGSLSAPSGSSVVTPITSAIQALVKTGVSPAAAETSIKTALGIPADVTLTTFDPFEAIDDANATTSANAKAVLASQTQLQMIVHAASATVAGADTNTSIADTMASVFTQIATTLNGESNVTLSVAQVTAVTKSVANDVYSDNPAAQVAVKSTAQDAATSAVTSADATFDSISTGNEADALANLDTGIVLANTTLQDELNASVAAQFAIADDLNETQLQAITDAQKAQEDAEAAIAEAAAQADATDKALYDALLAAQAEALVQAEVQRAAEAAAQEAAALAAAQEAQLQADAAAAATQAAADLVAARARAQADTAAAALRIAAAQAAAQAAQNAADLAAAQAAVQAANDTASLNIGIVDINSSVGMIGSYLNVATTSLSEIERLDANATLNAGADLSTMIATAQSARDDINNTQLINANETLANAISDANASTITSYVTDANTSKNNALGQKLIAQGALTSAREAINTAQIALAKAAADAIRNAEYNRLVGVIDANLTLAMNAVSLADTNATTAAAAAAQAQLDANATQAIANEYSSISATAALTAATAAAEASNAASTAATAAEAAKVIVANHKLWAETNSTVTGNIADETTAAAAATEAVAQATQAATQTGIALTKSGEAAGALQAAQTAKVTILIANLQGVAAVHLTAVQSASNTAVDSNTTATNAASTAQGLASNIGEAEAYTAAGEASAAASIAEANATAAVDAFTLASSYSSSLSTDTNVTSATQTVALIEAQITVATTAATAAATAASIAQGKVTFLQSFVIQSSSTNVNDAIVEVQRLGNLDAIDVSLTDTLSNMRANIADDITNGNKDSILLSALIDIVDILNSDAIAAIVEITDTNSTFSTTNLLDILIDDTATTTYSLATAADSAGGTNVLHDMATKLATASDTVGSSFENTTKVISYVGTDYNISINQNDSLRIRAAALSAASSLDFIASYSYGDVQTYFATQTKDINNTSYEYIQAGVDPLAMLNQSTFFTMNKPSRLAMAGSYLQSAVTLVSEVVITYPDDIDAIEEALAIKAAFNGDGVYKENNATQESINLIKLFSSTDYIDRNDFTIPTSYLGKSTEAIAEYERLISLKNAKFDYDLAQCQDYNSSRVAPTDDIDYDLVHSESTRVVTPDEDLSIIQDVPVYGEDTRRNRWINNGNNCQVMEYPANSDFYEAEFDIEPNSDFKEVIVVDVLENYFEGQTIHFVNSEGQFATRSLAEDGTFTGTFQSMEITATSLKYWIDSTKLTLEMGPFSNDGGMTTFNKYLVFTYLSDYSVDAKTFRLDVYLNSPYGNPISSKIVHTYTNEALMHADTFYADYFNGAIANGTEIYSSLAINANKFKFFKITIGSGTSATRQTALSIDGNVSFSEESFNAIYSLDGNILTVDSNESTIYFKAEDVTSTSMSGTVYVDLNNDGVVDTSRADTRYFSRPSDFPSNISSF